MICLKIFHGLAYFSLRYILKLEFSERNSSSRFPLQVDESKEQERLERKIQRAPAGQGTVRMLTREEWEEIQEVRPRTPFESHLARPNARIRTGDSMHLVRTLASFPSLVFPKRGKKKKQ